MDTMPETAAAGADAALAGESVDFAGDFAGLRWHSTLVVVSWAESRERPVNMCVGCHAITLVFVIT